MSDISIFQQVADKIIKEQENIIGPVALEQAKKVPGLKYDEQNREITLQGNATDIIENLVEKYKDLFGQASVEVCRDAARSFMKDLPKDQVPALLR